MLTIQAAPVSAMSYHRKRTIPAIGSRLGDGAVHVDALPPLDLRVNLRDGRHVNVRAPHTCGVPLGKLCMGVSEKATPPCVEKKVRSHPSLSRNRGP